MPVVSSPMSMVQPMMRPTMALAPQHTLLGQQQAQAMMRQQAMGQGIPAGMISF